MPPTPRSTIESDFTQGKSCAICGEPSLKVTRLESLPDYISCDACHAAFVLEEAGERVLFGKIPDQYPETQRFALKQWVWLEAVEKRANRERPEQPVPPPDPTAVAPPEIQPDAQLEKPSEQVEPAGSGLLDVEGSTAFPPEIQPEPTGVPLEMKQDQPEVEPPHLEPDADIPAWLRTPVPPPTVPLESSDPTPVMDETEAPPPDRPEGDLAIPLEDEPVRLEDLIGEPAEGVPELAEQVEQGRPDRPPEEPPLLPDQFLETEIVTTLPMDEPSLEEAEPPEKPSTPEADPAPAEEPPPLPSEPPEPGEEISAPSRKEEGVVEPAPGTRARVILRGTQANFQEETCVHCMRSPARQKMVVIAAEGPADDSPSAHTLPMCNSCHRRARAKSDDEKNARLMAILTATLVSLLTIVVALALGWVNFQQSVVVDTMILAILAVVSYTVPAWLLLTRASRFPPPADAQFVRSTLLMQVAKGGIETIYDWRNEAYAKRFVDANYQTVSGDLLKIPDTLAPELDPQDKPVDPDPGPAA